MYINVNAMTIPEVLKIGTNEQIREKLETIDTIEADCKANVIKAERDNEIISEQLYFARELIEELQIVLKSTTRLTDFKKTFKNMLGNSMLEL